MSKAQKLLLFVYCLLSVMSYPSVCPLLPPELTVYANGDLEALVMDVVLQSLVEVERDSDIRYDVDTWHIASDNDDYGGQGDDDDIRSFTPIPTPYSDGYGGQGDDDDIRPFMPTPTATPTGIGG